MENLPPEAMCGQSGGVHGPDGKITHYQMVHPRDGDPWIKFSGEGAMYVADLRHHLHYHYHVSKPEGGFSPTLRDTLERISRNTGSETGSNSERFRMPYSSAPPKKDDAWA